MSMCYECLKLVISLSYRGRCVHCEAANAKANREENDLLQEQIHAQQIAHEHVIAEKDVEIAELRSENKRMDNLLALDVHSCGPNCTKSPCVNRRLREENGALQKEITSLRAINAACEQQEPVGCTNSPYTGAMDVELPLFTKLYSRPDPDAAQLRLRVKELEQEYLKALEETLEWVCGLEVRMQEIRQMLPSVIMSNALFSLHERICEKKWSTLRAEAAMKGTET